jgi:hypothetical protein
MGMVGVEATTSAAAFSKADLFTFYLNGSYGKRTQLLKSQPLHSFSSFCMLSSLYRQAKLLLGPILGHK